MRKMLALYATLLAGTHMAASVQPSYEPSSDQPVAIPIQWGGYGAYGYPGRTYGDYGSDWHGYGNRGGRGYYYGPMDGPSWGRDMDPEEYGERQSRRYRYRGGYNNPPWMGRGW